MITVNQKSERIKAIMEAFQGGKTEDLKVALENFYDGISEGIKADFLEYQQTHDDKVLAQRGYRQLTSDEKKFYEGLVKSVKADRPQASFVEDIPGGAMPTTIIEDVFKEIRQEHPLLEAINFRYVGTAIKWILSDHTSQKAKWGKITDAIVEELSSGLIEIDITQNKLSAFVYIEKGLIEMGPTFLDAYVREVLKESLALGLEDGIINGTGVNEPIGMTRDIHEGVDVSTIDGYPEKKAVKLKSLSPLDYGNVLAPIAKTEKGNNRTFDEVTFICNQTDYLTKVMPATTILNGNGNYSTNVFPFATRVKRTATLKDGYALVGLPEEYSAFIGGSEKGTIEVSDHYKFIEDWRAYKIKLYGTGRAYDNTCWILLDISELEPTYLTVKMKEAVVEA